MKPVATAPSILVVEDDLDFLAYLRLALEAAGYAVTTADCGTEAAAVLEKRRFAVVLTDLRLPEMSGLDVLAAARRADPLAVGIVLTAHDLTEAAVQALDEGAYDYLIKPCATELVLAAVRRGIKHYELQRALAHKTAQLEQLQDKLADKARLLQDVSHELKNPLSVILGYASFLLTRAEELGRPLPDDAVRGLRAIHSNSERLELLVGDLIESLRLESRKVALERLAVPAQKLAHEAVEDIRVCGLRKEIALRLEAPVDEPLLIHADPRRIHQILANLLSNAVKFTPAGGAVTVRVAKGEGVAVFSVKDTGVGIVSEDIPHIFDRHFQGRHGRRHHQGLGLGLEICKGLVELHGGTIWAESRPDDGAAFFFTIPLALHVSQPVVK